MIEDWKISFLYSKHKPSSQRRNYFCKIFQDWFMCFNYFRILERLVCQNTLVYKLDLTIYMLEHNWPKCTMCQGCEVNKIYFMWYDVRRTDTKIVRVNLHVFLGASTRRRRVSLWLIIYDIITIQNNCYVIIQTFKYHGYQRFYMEPVLILCNVICISISCHKVLKVE